MSQYQKGKTNLDFTEARDNEWQWHQLGHMQVWTSLQTDNNTSTPPLCFLQAWCPSYLPAAQPTASKHWRQQVLIMTLLKSQIPGRWNTHSHLNHQTTQQLSGDIVVSPTKTLGQQSLLSTNQSYTRRMVTKPFSLRNDILLLQSLSMWSGMLTMVFSNKNTWMSNFQTNWISIWQQILSSAD